MTGQNFAEFKEMSNYYIIFFINIYENIEIVLKVKVNISYIVTRDIATVYSFKKKMTSNACH